MNPAVLVGSPWIVLDEKWNSSMYTPGVRGATMVKKLADEWKVDWVSRLRENLSRSNEWL
jgi:hypothetical protein